MPLEIVETSASGNAVATAWSSAGLLAIVTRAGWRGPLRGFVFDASDPTALRRLASFPIPNEPRTGAAGIWFGEADPEVVTTSDGRTASRWDARTGARLGHCVLAGPNEHGRALELLPSGELVVCWLDTSGDSPRFELRTVDIVTGAHRCEPDPLIEPAARGWFLPLLEASRRGLGGGQDYVAVHDRRLIRFGPDGVERWAIDPVAPINLLHVDSRALVLVSHAARTAEVRSPDDGRLLAEIAIEGVRAIGVLDGPGLGARVWLATGKGELVWHDELGSRVRVVALDRLCMDVVLAPNGEHALVLVDRMNLESAAHVVDLADGSTVFATTRSFAPNTADRAAGTLWIAGGGGVVRIDRSGSLTSIHTKPSAALAVARTTGTAVFISMLKVLVADPSDPKPRAIDKILGESIESIESIIAISHDGTRVFVVDERHARLIDVESGQRVFALTTERLEEWTIDPVDRAFFDEAGEPHIVVGDHVYRVGPDEAVPPSASEPLRVAGIRVEVGLDEIITIHAAASDPVIRVHLSPNGKAGIVEDGEALDWLGPPAQAKKCRTVLGSDGQPVTGKPLDRLVRASLIVTALETA